MNFLKKLFGKKIGEDQPKQSDTQLKASSSTENSDTFIKPEHIVRTLTEEQKEKIEKSTILLRTGQLYMHYWTDKLVCENRNDPEWNNKVMFFWKAEEPFPRKALPPIFLTFKVKHFLFKSKGPACNIHVGQAMPWFGMPGLGEKHFCEIAGEKTSVPELHQQGIIDYIEQVELSNENLDILTDKENYLFLIDNRLTPFHNGSFHFEGKPIPIHLAYSIGGIHIIKNVSLE